MSVPKTAHQIWIGSTPPIKFQNWHTRLKKMNPDWEFRFHANEIFERYGDDPYIKAMRVMNERHAFIVDRLRVLVLRDEGGLYCDTDCYPMRPFSLLDEVWNNPHATFVAGLRSPDRQSVSVKMPGVPLCDITFLASAKGSRMINRLCDLYRPDARRHTGASMGMEILRNSGPDTILLGFRHFYAEQDNPDAILLHDGANLGSWLIPNKIDHAALTR